MMPLRTFPLALCCSARVLFAQEPAPRAIAAPSTPLSQLSSATSVIERDDGSALVVLSERGQLAQIAAGTRAVSMLPLRAAYGRAMTLENDRVGVTRLSQHDVLVLDATGQPIDSLAMPSAGGTFVIGNSAASPLFDAQHRRYELAASRATPDVPLTRYDGDRATMIAMLRQQARARISIGGGGSSSSAGRAFEPIDAWALAPDGRVAVVRGRDYRVVWFGVHGDSASGPSVPVAPVAVTDAHKAAFRAEQQAAIESARKMLGGTLGDASMTVPEPVWPDVMPAMRGSAVILGADGTLWVPRHGDPASRVTVWDAFDARGERRTRIAIPSTWTLIGAGRRTLYLVGAQGLAIVPQ